MHQEGPGKPELRQGAVDAVGKCDQPQKGYWTFFLPNLFRWDLVIFASFKPQWHFSEREGMLEP